MKSHKRLLLQTAAVMMSILMAIAYMPVTGADFANAADDQDNDALQDEMLVDEGENAEADAIDEAAGEEPSDKDVVLKTAGDPSSVDEDGFEEDESGFAPVDESNYIEIGAGTQQLCEIVEDEQVVTYKFTPEATGTYIFYSSPCDDEENQLDPKGRVLAWDSVSGTYRQKTSSDDIDYSEGNRHFKMTFNAVAGETYYLQAILLSWDGVSKGKFNVGLDADFFKASISVKLNKSTGKATVTGTVQGDTFDALYVDGEMCSADIEGKTSLSGVTINMKNYDVGVHDVYAVLTNHSEEKNWVHNKSGVKTYIYKTPSNKTSYYWTGNKKFKFDYGGSSYKNCKLMLEYKKSGGKWKKTKKFSTASMLTQKKLSVGKKYSVRAYFVWTGKYKGKSYTITGKSTGKVSKSVSIKTSAAKPKIKSIKINKAKVSSYSYVRPAITIYSYGVPMYYRPAQLVTVYSTTATVTIKLKKKPGAAGIYVNGKKLKGNKKTYKTKLTFDGKKKGKKVKIKVYSYQSTTYKGNSSSVSKKVKVKK